MKDMQQSRIAGIGVVIAAMMVLAALVLALTAPGTDAHASQAARAVGAVPAHESETAEATETQHPEATQTEHPEATRTEHPEATETAHPEATETEHPEATETAHPEATETEHPEATQTEHPEATETEHPEATQTEHPEASHTPEATETEHPEATHTPEASHTPEATHTPGVGPSHLLTLNTRLQFGDVHAGDTRTYTLSLHNGGTTASQVALSVMSHLGWPVSVTPSGLLLAPGGDAVIAVTVRVPQSVTSGLDTDTILATDGSNTTTAYVALLTTQHAFTDLTQQDWSWHPVQFLATQNVLSGYADGSFRPSNTVTRAQVAKMLVGGMGWTLFRPARATFSDVPTTDWAFPYVETAAQHGVLAGYSDGTFRPYNNVTRAQLAKLIVTARGWSLIAPASAHFSDVASANWAYGFVETAVDAGVLTGYSDGTFRPGAPATRAQVAKILTNGLVLDQQP